MDQTLVKLCHLVTGSNKELRKIQIPWTFRTLSWYYYKIAQDMYDPAHSQPEIPNLSSCTENSHGSRTEHTLTLHLEQTSSPNSQFVLAFPNAGKKQIKLKPSILQSRNSLVFVGCVWPKPEHFIKRKPILHFFFFRTSIHAAFYKFLEPAILVRGWVRRIYKLEMQHICFPLILYTVLTRPLVLGKPLKVCLHWK